MERRETHAKLGHQMQSPRGKREGLYLYTEAFMEPMRDSLSFLGRLPTQAHPKSETAPKHTLWLPFSQVLSPRPQIPPGDSWSVKLNWGAEGGVPGVRLVSAALPHPPASPPYDKLLGKTLTGVYHICLYPCCPSGSRATQEGKEPVCGCGSRRGSG